MADVTDQFEESKMITLADATIANAFTQLEIDDPELAAEIEQVIRNEVRALEISFSIAIMDMRKTFREELAALKAAGTPLDPNHFLSVLDEVAEKTSA